MKGRGVQLKKGNLSLGRCEQESEKSLQRCLSDRLKRSTLQVCVTLA